MLRPSQRHRCTRAAPETRFAAHSPAHARHASLRISSLLVTISLLAMASLFAPLALGCASRGAQVDEARPAPEASEAGESQTSLASPAPSAAGTRTATGAQGAPAAPVSSDARSASADPPPTLEELRGRLGAATSRAEIEALLRDVGRALETARPELSYAELLDVEHAITAEVDAWVEAHSAEGGLERGEACLASAECSAGPCAGRGCIPGAWRCQARSTGPLETDDMRTECLCSGVTYQGSSTRLQRQRYRNERGACPEELRYRPPRTRR